MSEIFHNLELNIGEKVCYQPTHYKENEWENGIIKEVPNFTKEAVRVVYNCAGNWKNFKEYTSALTNLRDLKLGWKAPDIDLDINCPGCNIELTTDNAGGYRTFCRKCVTSMPTSPKDGKGHLIKEGCKYPNFEWD